ncbi:MAG: PQQ-binding-like beta-propeller repeat protein [Sphingobacteriia bacterium]|nr:PQQ-binding-like beta-propeller repeat protein [Sphingobacteriia bacterium]
MRIQKRNNILLILLILVLNACSTFSELDFFSKPPKKLEGKRVSPFEEEVENSKSDITSLQLPSYSIDYDNLKILNINDFSGKVTAIHNLYENTFVIAGKRIALVNQEGISEIPLEGVSKLKNPRIYVNNSIYLTNANSIKSYTLNGHEVWSYNFDYPARSRPMEINRNVCTQLINFSVSCIDIQSGMPSFLIEDSSNEIIAKTNLNLLNDGEITFFSTKDGTLRAVNILTQQPMWEFTAATKFDPTGLVFYNLSLTPQMYGDIIYLANFSSGLFAINKYNGNTIWKVALKMINKLDVSGNIALVSDVNNNINILNALTGEIYWNVNKVLDKKEKVVGLYLSNAGANIIADSGKVYIIDTLNGKLKTTINLKHKIKGALKDYNKIILTAKNKLIFLSIK